MERLHAVEIVGLPNPIAGFTATAGRVAGLGVGFKGRGEADLYPLEGRAAVSDP